MLRDAVHPCRLESAGNNYNGNSHCHCGNNSRIRTAEVIQMDKTPEGKGRRKAEDPILLSSSLLDEK